MGGATEVVLGATETSSSHQRQLHAPGGDMAVHGVVLGAVCRVG